MDKLIKAYWKDIFDLPIPLVSIDIVIFTIYNWKLCVLLDIKWDEKLWIKYILPWWIINKWVSVDDNFEEILEKRTWLKNLYRHQFWIFWDLNRDPRWQVISLWYISLVCSERLKAEADFSKVRIIELDNIDEIEIWFHFDHKWIIENAKRRLDFLLDHTNIVINILPSKFTLSQIHKAYETILWTEIDKRNFLKKILYINLVKETWELDKSSSKRPARLYEFAIKDFTPIDIR